MTHMIRALIFLTAACLSAPAFASIDGAPATAPLFQLAYEDVESAISSELTEKTQGSKIAATVSDRKMGPLFSYDKPVEVEIRGLRTDQNTRRWSANLLVVSGEVVVSAMPIAGKYEEMFELPVLKRQLRAGEVIKEGDIEIRDFPGAQIRSETVLDMASLIGRTPVRSISPSRPIRESEIEAEAVMKKDAMVQLRYKSGGIEILASGQALDDGAAGKVIDIKNVDSKSVVRAVVVDANTAEIVAPDESIRSAKAEDAPHENY